MPIQDDHLEAIVASVLAVNAYGLGKAYDLLPSLRESGLTNPQLVSRRDVGEVLVRLSKAGYDRGFLVEMMAGRLINLMDMAADGNLDALNNLVRNGNEFAAKELLCTVKGIGPKVASDAWMLMTSRANPSIKKT
jgi:hypothetical protein